ncbi:helix-turn-helix domain-containing protein [Dysgonomonas sp. ZJ709]|uniref:helix-turn-helix domain-containing protein n=1 Tax=Dysgonomonas sp. ZJ709 TaxID=2709797 RepID=UPI0013EB22FB|nr:helix-turn-helix domain-containing protein [Dysgonomonas sp. ZJ709]
MKDRIRQIMESEQLTPSVFADKLDIGRAVISHILNGRNNPSLDVVTRILAKMDYINSDWLLTGNGKMYKSEIDDKVNRHIFENKELPNNPLANTPDLFTQSYVNPHNDKEEIEYRKETIVNQPEKLTEHTNIQSTTPQKVQERKVSKIIIYYTDNTFETFNADHRPL